MMKIANATAGTANRIRRPRSPPTSAPPEAPDARLVCAQRLLEVGAREVRPQDLGEVQLAVGRLPHQEVRDPLLAARPDHQVGIMHLRRVEQLAERLFPTARVALGGVEDLRAATVVERDEQRDAVVGRRLLLGPPHLLDQLRVDALATADEAHPHALLVQLRRLAEDPRREHRHQRIALVLRARPVLGRERVHGQLADAEVDGVAQAGLDGVRPGLVPFLDGQPALLGPAPVAIRDDGDVGRGHTSRISASLPLSRASSSLTLSSVSFWSASSARCSSSAPDSPASRSSLRSCMTSRRMLRSATLPSSVRPRTTLTSCLRRSSVSSGRMSRIRLPSLFGVRPRSDSMIERSIALIAVLS